MQTNRVRVGDLWEYHTGFERQPPFRALVLEVLSDTEEEIQCNVWVLEKGWIKLWSWDDEDISEIYTSGNKSRMVLVSRVADASKE